jgi:hypothetical protein
MKKIALALSVGLALVILTGCDILGLLDWDGEETDAQSVANTAEEVRRAQNLEPVDEDGNVDVSAAANLAQRQITGSTGDPEVDAVLGAGDLIEDIWRADQHMYIGRQNRDPQHMRLALGYRPNDWNYQVSYAVLLFERGDFASAGRVFSEADTNGTYPRDEERYARHSVRELEGASDIIERHVRNNPDNQDLCRMYYGRLARHYRVLAEATASDSDWQKVTHYETQLDLCLRGLLEY